MKRPLARPEVRRHYCRCGRVMTEQTPGVYECPLRSHGLGHDSWLRHDVARKAWL